MRQIALPVALVAFALLAPTASAQAITWEQIWDEPGTAVVYIDRSSIAGPPDLRSLKTRTVYKGSLPEGYITERIRSEEFDCKRRRSRLLYVTIIGNDGRAPTDVDFAAEAPTWSAPLEADTLGGAKLRIACGLKE